MSTAEVGVGTHEFGTKRSFFWTKSLPIASGMAELVGKDVFTFAGKWPWA